MLRFFSLLLILTILPNNPLTSSRYMAFLGRLIVFYACIGALGGLLAAFAFTAYALATALPEHPEPAPIHGCTVLLPNIPGDDPSVPAVRTARPLSACDGSIPVSFGASVKDGGAGTR